MKFFKKCGTLLGIIGVVTVLATSLQAYGAMGGEDGVSNTQQNQQISIDDNCHDNNTPTTRNDVMSTILAFIKNLPTIGESIPNPFAGLGSLLGCCSFVKNDPRKID